ncbi:MAG: type II toxin-antitoxin system RatA family toxin [Spongiibacteraceae bacterium]
MNEIRRSALLPYSAATIYELVNDIESYPSYMDGCVGAEILRRDEGVIEARLDLSRGGVRLSFITRNTLLPPERVTLSLLDGPFESLTGEWALLALGDSAVKVSLHLQFALSGKIVSLASRQLFNTVANNLVDALVKRANELYGK